MESGRVVHRLPRGRHRLTREEVVTSQRMRILEAMAHAVAEKGYAKATVADVIGRAGVSRETFYEQFADKEDCFLRAFDTAVDLLLSEMGAALGAPGDDRVARFERGLDAYLEALAENPTLARTFLIEVYGAGPRAVAQRVEVQQRFVDAIAAVFGARSKRDRFACEALVAAISSLVTTRVGGGSASELPALRGPIMDLVRRALEDRRAAA